MWHCGQCLGGETSHTVPVGSELKGLTWLLHHLSMRWRAFQRFSRLAPGKYVAKIRINLQHCISFGSKLKTEPGFRVLVTPSAGRMVSPYQTQGRWQHSSGGEIEIKVDGTGQSVAACLKIAVNVISHPTVGKQTLETSKFCSGDGLDYFGFKGKMDGDKITWNNGVVWTKQL
eukprot:s482_g8.t1